ncbi:hypothetical protein FRC11_003478, partial [Ceratobasidium sp. 423]
SYAVSKYSIHKVNIPLADRDSEVTSLGEPLSDSDLVSQQWPEGFPLDVFRIALKKLSGTTSVVSSYTRKTILVYDRVTSDPTPSQGQLKIIQALNGFTTSTLATPSHFKKFQSKVQLQILNGRPQRAVGLPVGLFHPVFDSFQRRIDSTSFAATPFQLSLTLRLLTASQAMYDHEDRADGRAEALKPILSSLLGLYIQTAEIPGTKSDGVLQGGNGAYYMIIEVKNEIGKGGRDPAVQAAIAFSKYWGQPSLTWLRDRSCSPSFILAVAGPWMCILGGVMLKHPVVQPLTPFFSVANNPFSALYPETVAKIFASLAHSLSELDQFYGGFQETTGGPDSMRFNPYIRHFTHEGQRVDIGYKTQVPGKAVFRALASPQQGDPYPIMVKFAESYNLTAHRLLETKRLAPKLLFISSEGSGNFKVSQRIMVVMEEALGRDLAGASSVPDCVRDDVGRALDLLHKHNMVFGDLRPPNILAVENQRGQVTGGMLIDFDWCGMDGQATYPSDINLAIEWPEGVGPGLTMSQAHDQEMYKKL